VITNSLPVIYELQDSGVSLNIIGGELDDARQAMHGTIANEHIARYRATKAFLGVDGISLNGLFANSEKEAGITTAFAANSAYTYLLCDAGKNRPRNVSEVWRFGYGGCYYHQCR
jgi:DeoR family fructose operon transcriptional repressor